MTPARARCRPGPAAVVAGVVGLATAAGLAWLRPRRVVVEGRSMEPGLAPGDRLLVTRAGRVHPGDVVAVRDPRHPRRVLVKRVAAVLGDEVAVRGDNPGASTDSRHFGTVPARSVLGRVARRYAPSWRAGPVR